MARARKFDYATCRAMRLDGESIAALAEFFDVTVPAINYALSVAEYEETGVWRGARSQAPDRLMRGDRPPYPRPRF